MSFSTPNYFGNVCPYHEPDSTQYGPGTSRPVGFKLAEMMMLFWQADNFIIDSFFASASYGQSNTNCGGDGTHTCSCNAVGSGGASSPSNPRIPSPISMSKILCGATLLSNSVAGSASVSINMSSIATDILIDTSDKWNTALFYPTIAIIADIPDDGTGDCNDVTSNSCLPGIGSCDCVGSEFRSDMGGPQTGIPDGVASWSGPGTSFPPIDIYAILNGGGCVCETGYDVCNGGPDQNGFIYGSRQCGPLDGTDCPFCLTNDPLHLPAPVCGNPGSPPPPDCNEANCQTDCLPSCCGNGCYSSDIFSPPCTVDSNGCSPADYSGDISMVLKFDTTVPNQ